MSFFDSTKLEIHYGHGISLNINCVLRHFVITTHFVITCAFCNKGCGITSIKVLSLICYSSLKNSLDIFLLEFLELFVYLEMF